MTQSFFRYISILGFFAFGFFAFAQGTEVRYPVAELGNCGNKDACETYCDIPENGPQCLEFGKKSGLLSEAEVRTLKVLPEQKGPGGCSTDTMCREYCSDAAHSQECIAFAEEHGLGDQKELQRAKDFLEKPGPGGCKGQECKTYCDDPAHANECIDFAVQNGFMSKEEAARAKKFANKAGPGGCRGQECRAYCEDPNHADECLTFSEENEFISKEEAARIRKLALTPGPGGCKGQECKTYCDDPAHANECIDFAVQNGFMSKEEAARAKKFANKAGPGGCKGKDQCEAYCHDPAHQEECLAFAEENGLMPKEELERAKKFLKISQEGGPGGCKGKDQCEAYCRDPQNQQTCFEFAKKQGFIRPEDERNFEIGKKLEEKLKEAGGPGGCKNEDECRIYCQDPGHAEECVAFASAHAGISKEEAGRMLKEFSERRFEARGEFRPPEDFEEFDRSARQKFEEFRVLEEKFRSGGGEFPAFSEGAGFVPGGEQGGAPDHAMVGPGGCASPTECITYCSEHPQECFQAGPPSGQPGGQNQGAVGPQGFNGRPGEFVPRLQGDLIKEFNPADIPQTFGSEEERHEFFKKKMEEFRGQPGAFPGRPPQVFPGQGIKSFSGNPEVGPEVGFPPENREFMKKQGEIQQEFFEKEHQQRKEFMGKQFENQQELQKHTNDFQGRPEGFQTQPFNSGTNVRPEGVPGMNKPAGEFHQPEGSFGFPSGSRPPEGSFSPPPSGTFHQEPSGTFQPPPSDQPSPSSRGPANGFFANFLYILR